MEYFENRMQEILMYGDVSPTTLQKVLEVVNEAIYNYDYKFSIIEIADIVEIAALSFSNDYYKITPQRIKEVATNTIEKFVCNSTYIVDEYERKTL